MAEQIENKELEIGEDGVVLEMVSATDDDSINTPAKEDDKPVGKESGTDDGNKETGDNQNNNEADSVVGAEPKAEEKKENIDKNVSGEKPGADGEEASGSPDDIELKLPEEESVEVSDESSWVDVSSALGLEVKEDDFESFKSAYEKNIETIKEQTKTSVIEEIKKNPEKILDNVDTTTKSILDYTKNGGDINDLINPMKKYDELLILQDSQLMKKEYVEQGLTGDEADKLIGELEEKGTLGIEAKRIRNTITSLKEEELNDITAKQAQIKAEKDKQNDENKQMADKLFVEKLTGQQKFRGIALKQEHKDYVNKLWKSGQVHEMMKKPEMVIEFLLDRTFGEQISKRREEAAYKRGLDEVKKGLHNIPPDISSGGVQNTEQPKTNNGEIKLEEGEEVQLTWVR